jgi:alpha-tubulin suppressor-like RCC1 family protein
LVIAKSDQSFELVSGKIFPLLSSSNGSSAYSMFNSDNMELMKVKDVSAGSNFNILLTTNGDVYTWGKNSSGQLGDLNNADKNSPGKVKGLPKIVSISAGKFHSLALANDGSVWAWGNNVCGQVGNGTKLNQYKPIRIVGLDNVIKIYACSNHSLALKADG